MKRELTTPNYYKSRGVEVLDFIEAFDLGFCLGNVVKYIARAGKKGSRMEDLMKAQDYLLREIMNTRKRDTNDESTND